MWTVKRKDCNEGVRIQHSLQVPLAISVYSCSQSLSGIQVKEEDIC